MSYKFLVLKEIDSFNQHSEMIQEIALEQVEKELNIENGKVPMDKFFKAQAIYNRVLADYGLKTQMYTTCDMLRTVYGYDVKCDIQRYRLIYYGRL